MSDRASLLDLQVTISESTLTMASQGGSMCDVSTYWFLVGNQGIHSLSKPYVNCSLTPYLRSSKSMLWVRLQGSQGQMIH